jgi:NAD(P)-dependent dehydrogenase (short-subunit alcohol dehydrogenase family)
VASVAHLLRDRSVAAEIGRVEVSAAGTTRRWRVAGAGALTALAAALALMVGRPGDRARVPQPVASAVDEATHREQSVTTTAAPNLVAPAGAVAAADTFRWSNVPHADRYRLTLYDRDATVVWEAEGSDTAMAMPPSIALDGHTERMGGIDCVMANAGVAPAGFVRNIDPEAFERVIEVNLVGVWRTVRAALPYVMQSRGYVLIVASAAAILRAQQRGVVVVASAGNDGSCRPTYPAAIPGVVSVGALGPAGPPRFTNHGSWVRACAPGVDIVSSFFAQFDGREVPSGGQDIDMFRAWAMWSGTSFAAPVVAGALVREMRIAGCTPAQAVQRVIDAPALGRIPGLGTIVNV